VRRIAEALPVRFVTNVTSVASRRLAAHLRSLGLLDDEDALYTPATTARRVLEPEGRHAGLLLVRGPTADDYAWFREDPEGPTVLLGTEGHDLRIEALQPAFRRLRAGAALYALQRNRYFEREGELVTDVGPLAAFLAYAADCETHVLGKPSPLLFDAIARDAGGVKREQLLMVGDDAEFDVAAAVEIGLAGVLVRTGKYREGDEARIEPAPTDTLDSIADLPPWLGLERPGR
jgi:HAD superfamily hydrolase (TIGR01458 family)